jgi:hypothetical protein
LEVLVVGYISGEADHARLTQGYHGVLPYCEAESRQFLVGKGPIPGVAAECYLAPMNLLLLLLVLLLLFGGGGFYFGGPVIGGSGLGLVVLICLIVYFMGGFRSKA